MAQRVHVTIDDDIDGGAASETIRFGLDGVEYEIDLNETNAGELRDSLAVWVGHARRVGGRKKSGSNRSVKRDDLDEVRAWARENGYQVSERGRVAAKVLDAYDAAH